MLSYVGNGAYCYANSTSMLLNTIGEKIPPETIEVLTGVGLGTVWFEEDKMFYFSVGVPHTGVSKALDILGFAYVENSSTSADRLEELLTSEITRQPVMLGPLDMAYLSYNPNHRFLQGCDHYVLAFRIEGGNVLIHDPAGYPNVILPLDNLFSASKTSRLQFRMYPRDLAYHYWCAPKRVKHPSPREIYQEAIRYFRQVYQEAEGTTSEHNWQIGRDAIMTLKRHMQERTMEPGIKGHLTHFAFQLGAKRALNYREFFQSENETLANLKLQQSEVFGKCHSLAVQEKWSAAGEALNELADLEDQFLELLFR
ncbi:BtrH N-terminal domain-containing protein [Paenibacillus alkalitolerans]|uniref:BtrH N-terminal domain-containing protein n=1 Tax=Paenibacillus alkalitolerans TaxID=2799335 RepID=UPI0018F6BE8C|nr:BtrH N-terminal domain-containing protein [Paenibacillus alkalitolerans]